ncbi:MAG: c-type cytochrome domain-containing protein [Flavitalea sp.]
MLIAITEFIGRLHPLLVHLPIGMLVIACLLQWLSVNKRFQGLQQAVSIILFCGMLTAIASGITGYVLSTTDDYDEELVNTHQWLGIFTTIISIVFYFLHRRKTISKLVQGVSVILFILIILTGHLGGTLTHGSDYLSFSGSGNITTEKIPIPDIQEAAVYTDVVQPLLQNRCYSCHGKNKQKGGLRVDDSARLRKGGKDGIVLIAGKADESEMIKRLLLPRNHEDHMPPKEKPQLSEQEIAVLHWWVASGAPFHKKVKELQQTEKVKPALLSFQKTGNEKPRVPDIPGTPVKRADQGTIDELKKRGVVVLPVSQNSNYLAASFVSADSIYDIDIRLLLPIQDQLVWLKIGSTMITDSSLVILSKFKNLTKLYLNNTNISDTGLAHLRSMNNIQYLNLVGTNVTSQGVLTLKELKNLQSLYLYHTRIKSSEWPALKNNFPNTIIDSGGYTVPFFDGDTVEVKQKKSY